jgi:hypothetical protein
MEDSLIWSEPGSNGNVWITRNGLLKFYTKPSISSWWFFCE